MKLSLPAVAAAAVLVVVSGAQARIPPNGVDVCGRSGCVHLAFEQSQLIWTGGHEIGRPLRVPSPFYLLRYKWFATDPEQTAYYVPAARAVRFASERATDATWMWLDRDAASVVDRAAAGLTPYAVTPPTTVTVGDKQARGPETYLRLLRGRGGGLITPATVWITVTLRSSPPTPWTDGSSDIRLSAPGRSRIVLVDGWAHKIPLRIANRARRGLPLSP
jgi:hypothetical protein